MAPSIYTRLFDRLTDLLPQLTRVTESSTFYAPARVKDDMALHCVVKKVEGSVVEIELAHDLVVKGQEQASPWMVFKADMASRTAELLAIQEERQGETSYYEIRNTQGYVDPRRAPLHVYAVNWLAVFINMQFVFRPFVNPAIAA